MNRICLLRLFSKLPKKRVVCLFPFSPSKLEHEQSIIESLESGYRSYSVAREARFMKKLVTGARHSRNKWFNKGETGSKPLTDLSFLIAGRGGERSKQKQNSKCGRTLRRVGVLSTVFMEHITSLLATGEISGDILGLGLEITQVKISSEFNCINVYWYSSSTSEKEDLEPHLKRIAGELRHLLSQLRVIGQVPPIIFVKDDKHLKLMEVEKILSTIDFGEDYEPTSLGHNYKSTMSTQTRTKTWEEEGKIKKGLSINLSHELETQDEAGEEGICDEDNDSTSFVDPSPIMRQDVLGLNWEKIMDKIKLEVTRTRSKEKKIRDINLTDASISARTKEEILEEVNQNANRKKEFLTFLKQRRILKAKEEKRISTAAKEKEFLEQEKLERWMDSIKFDTSDYDFDPYEHEDYLEENEKK